MSHRSDFIEGWLASELTQLDVISVKRIYIDINGGNVFDGLMFSQIMYWHGLNKETKKPRMTIEREGELWLAKSYDDWMEECRINKHTARQCIDRIAERGLIIKRLWKFDGTPTVHIRIDWNVLETHIKSICYPISNPIDTTPQIELTPDVKSLTETTSQTTTKTTTKVSSPNGKDETFTCLIKTWLDEQESKSKGAYGSKEVRESAEGLYNAGITPVDIKAYIADVRSDDFWRSKFVKFQKLADEIIIWKRQNAPPATSDVVSPADDQTDFVTIPDGYFEGILK